MRSLILLSLLGAPMAGSLVGCSTQGPLSLSVKPATELIEITTVPEGVNVDVPGFGTVRTPANVHLDPSQTHELRFYLHGYEDRFVTVDTEVGEWTAHASSRTHQLEPSFIHLDMESGERLMTGVELAAWATAEGTEALAEANAIQLEVAGLIEEERASFQRTERARARAERQIAQARAILARDASRDALEAAQEARERALALRDEQHGMERITLDQLAAAEALLELVQQEQQAMMQLTEVTEQINAAALERERMLAIRRGVLPPETIEAALAQASPEFKEAMESIRSGAAFAFSFGPFDGSSDAEFDGDFQDGENDSSPAFTEVPGDTP